MPVADTLSRLEGLSSTDRDFYFVIDEDEDIDQSLGAGSEHRFRFYADHPDISGVEVLRIEYVSNASSILSYAATTNLGSKAQVWTNTYTRRLEPDTSQSLELYRQDGTVWASLSSGTGATILGSAGIVTQYNSAAHLIDDVSLRLGTGIDASLAWSTTQAIANALVLGIGVGTLAQGGHFILTTDTNRAKDHDLAISTVPRLSIFSATDPDTANTQYIQMYHDGTDGQLVAGTGIIRMTTNNLDIGNRILITNVAIRLNSASGVVIFNAGTGGSPTFATFSQRVNTSGTPTGLLWTAGAHTGLTAAITNEWNLDFSRNVTYLAGSAASYHVLNIEEPNLIGTAAGTTFTEASTVYIRNAPTAGANMTLVNSYALFVDDGLARFDGGITTTGTITTPITDTQIVYSASGVLSGDADFVFDGTHVYLGGGLQVGAVAGGTLSAGEILVGRDDGTAIAVARITFGVTVTTAEATEPFISQNADALFGAAAGITQNLGLYATSTGGNVIFYTNSVARWGIRGNSTGHLQAVTDNIYDIGATGTFRPRSVYIGTNLVVGNYANIGAHGLTPDSAGLLAGTASTAFLNYRPTASSTTGTLSVRRDGGVSLVLTDGDNATRDAQLHFGTNAGAYIFKVSNPDFIVLEPNASREVWRIVRGANAAFVVNDQADSGVDFRVEGVGHPSALFVDGANGAVSMSAWLNVGTTTLAVAQGDFAVGTTTNLTSWDESTGTLQIQSNVANRPLLILDSNQTTPRDWYLFVNTAGQFTIYENDSAAARIVCAT